MPYNSFGQDYLNNPFGLSEEEKQAQQAKLLRGDYFGGQDNPYTPAEGGVLHPAFQGGQKITEGQLRGIDQLAIDKQRDDEIPGMRSLMRTRAVDPWSALAQTAAAGYLGHQGRKRNEEKAGALEQTMRGERKTEAEKDRMELFREAEQQKFERGMSERGAAADEERARAATLRAQRTGTTGRDKIQNLTQIQDKDGNTMWAGTLGGEMVSVGADGQPKGFDPTGWTKVPTPAQATNPEIMAVYNPLDPDEETGQLNPINVIVRDDKMFNMDGSEIPADIAAQMIKQTPGEQGSEPPVIQPEIDDLDERRFKYEIDETERGRERARLKGVYDREIQQSQLGKMFAADEGVWKKATGLLDPQRYKAKLLPGMFSENFDYEDEKIQSQLKKINQAQLVYAAPGIELLGGSKPTDFDWTTVSGTVPTADDEPWVHIDYIKDTLAPAMKREADKEGLTEEGTALYNSYIEMADEARARLYPDAPTSGLNQEEQSDYLELQKRFGEL